MFNLHGEWTTLSVSIYWHSMVGLYISLHLPALKWFQHLSATIKASVCTYHVHLRSEAPRRASAFSAAVNIWFYKQSQFNQRTPRVFFQKVGPQKHIELETQIKFTCVLRYVQAMSATHRCKPNQSPSMTDQRVAKLKHSQYMWAGLGNPTKANPWPASCKVQTFSICEQGLAKQSARSHIHGHPHVDNPYSIEKPRCVFGYDMFYRVPRGTQVSMTMPHVEHPSCFYHLYELYMRTSNTQKELATTKQRRFSGHGRWNSHSDELKKWSYIPILKLAVFLHSNENQHALSGFGALKLSRLTHLANLVYKCAKCPKYLQTKYAKCPNEKLTFIQYTK